MDITRHNKRLQKALDSQNKVTKVVNYVHNMNYAIEIIVHFCGVLEPRE